MLVIDSPAAVAQAVSSAPKLIETTLTPDVSSAVRIAVSALSKVVLSELLLANSNRSMFASGARACTHSTSIEISCEELTLAVTPDPTSVLVNVGRPLPLNCGRLYWLLNS